VVAVNADGIDGNVLADGGLTGAEEVIDLEAARSEDSGKEEYGREEMARSHDRKVQA
jgi:hypothetical protein